jgi:hypothetical protein
MIPFCKTQPLLTHNACQRKNDTGRKFFEAGNCAAGKREFENWPETNAFSLKAGCCAIIF